MNLIFLVTSLHFQMFNRFLQHLVLLLRENVRLILKWRAPFFDDDDFYLFIVFLLVSFHFHLDLDSIVWIAKWRTVWRAFVCWWGLGSCTILFSSFTWQTFQTNWSPELFLRIPKMSSVSIHLEWIFKKKIKWFGIDIRLPAPHLLIKSRMELLIDR